MSEKYQSSRLLNPIPTKATASLLPLMLLCTSCMTPEEKNNLAVAALLTTAIAASPVLYAKAAYDKIPPVAAAREKRQQERMEEMKKAGEDLKIILDPIYKERLAAIQQHDPTSDAQALMADGIYYIISTNYGDEYPGLETRANYDTIIFSPYKAAALQNPSLNQILALISLKKSQIEQEARQTKGVSYKNEELRNAFAVAVWEYKKQFNITMYNYLYKSIYHVTPPPQNPQRQ